MIVQVMGKRRSSGLGEGKGLKHLLSNAYSNLKTLCNDKSLIIRNSIQISISNSQSVKVEFLYRLVLED